MNKEAYQKLLNENVTKAYKKTDGKTKGELYREAGNIAARLELADRIEVYAEREAFITLKDHKKRF
jgi:hypothetical protein